MDNTARKTGVLSVNDLSPELREKYETWKNRSSKSHPLYATAASEYGKVPRGIDNKVNAPEHGKGGGFSSTFTGGGAVRVSSLNTSITKHRWIKDLDPM